MCSARTIQTSSNTVWIPSEEFASACALSRFTRQLEARCGVRFSSYRSLHEWSIANPLAFWSEAVRFLEINGTGNLEPCYDTTSSSQPTPLARTWLPNFSLNFAENLLSGSDDELAIISWSEDFRRRHLTRGKIRAEVARVVDYLSSCNLACGERVFAYLPNIPEAITCMLATAARGATWSSCGTDYQIEGLIARAERVRPRILIAASSYRWREKNVSLLPTIEKLVKRVSSIEHVLYVDYLSDDTTVPCSARPSVSNASYSALLQAPTHTAIEYCRLPFSHPLYVMFSSGTTGKPKGIVHSAGGTLLEHKKELILHSDIRPGDRLFYQTSTSWMMWNWLVSGLACGATVVLYDGDTMTHDGTILWELASEEAVSQFGTNAAYLAEIEKRHISPGKLFQLQNLRAVFSTGSTLYPSQFDFVTREIKPLWLQSISGGTDIIGCFALGCPWLPVNRGEVQCKSLGYDVQVFNSQGQPVIGEQGELVCASPAPSMPVAFLDDPEGKAYQSAYFDDFPGVWRHGDFVEETTAGGLVFSGRSDATLKPGGVRVSTADIYAALQRVKEVQQALAVGYTAPGTASEKIILFVVLFPAVPQLTQELEDSIRRELKQANTFYVPALILQAPELPRTTNNKLAEIPVKRLLKGETPGNSSALANPESLEYFAREALPTIQKTLGA